MRTLILTLLLILSLATTAWCEEPCFDTSSEQAFRSSMQAVFESVPPARREAFAKALQTTFPATGTVEEREARLAELDGMTANDIFEASNGQ